MPGAAKSRAQIVTIKWGGEGVDNVTQEIKRVNAFRDLEKCFSTTTDRIFIRLKLRHVVVNFVMIADATIFLK